MFDLDLLPTFVVFAETLSFTESGRRCGLTQPAVHGQVKRLSEQIGSPLYRRQGRDLVLTARGVDLAALARDVVGSRDRFLGTTDVLRIAAGRGAWTHLLLPRLGAWLAQQPLEPTVADGPTAARLVLDGTVDIALSTDPPPVRTRHLFTVGTHVLLPRSHPLVDAPDVSLQQLVLDRWVLPSPGRPHRVVLEAMFRAAGLDIPDSIPCDDWGVTAGFVALGLGVAAVNDFVTHPDTVAVPLRDGPVQRYQLFWRHPRLDATVDHLYQTAL